MKILVTAPWVAQASEELAKELIAFCNQSLSPEQPGFTEFSGSGDTAIFGPNGRVVARAKSYNEELVSTVIPMADYRRTRVIPDVPMEMLKSAAGFRMTHIPYTGAGPAVLALMSGQVDAVASGPSTVVQQIKAGKLRALAHWGDKPLASLPEVPSLKQAGYGATFAQWSALFVPAGTPEDVVQKLRAAARKAAQDPNVTQTIVKAGSPVEYQDAPEFQAYWDADAALMVDAVRRIGKVE